MRRGTQSPVKVPFAGSGGGGSPSPGTNPPLSSELWVDGGTTAPLALRNGSINLPFASFAEALTVINASVVTNWKINAAPGVYAESLTVGEGYSLLIDGGGIANTIIGDGASNHVWTQSGDTSLTFQNLQLLGAFDIADGAIAPSFQAFLCFVDACWRGVGLTSITASGSHVVGLDACATISNPNTIAVNNLLLVFEGAVSINGDFNIDGVLWESLDLNCRNFGAQNSQFNGGPIELSGAQAQLVSTYASANIEFTGAAGVVATDRYSLSAMRANGVSVVNGVFSVVDFEYFSNTLYVDPTNPSAFGTIQDAINSVGPNGSARIILRPFRTYVENLVIDTGTFEICTDVFGSRISTVQGMPGLGAEIVGSITWQPGDDQGITFRNVRVTGDASILVGTTSGHGATLRLECVDWVGNIISSGPGWCNLIAKGWPPMVNTDQHRITGTVDMLGGPDGFLVAEHYSFTGAISAFSPTFYNCTFRSGSSITSSSAFLNLRNSVQAFGNMPITFSGSAGIILADEFTVATILERIAVITNGELYPHGNFLGRRSSLANNSGPNNIFIGNPPAGTYRVSWSYYVTTAGTNGLAQPKLTYTGPLGNVTVNLGAGIDITGTGHVQGDFTFRSDGTANIAWTVDGIVTPGALASTFDIVCENINKRL